MDTAHHDAKVAHAGVTLLRALMAAGVPERHRYIMWLDWLRRSEPDLAHFLDRIRPKT